MTPRWRRSLTWGAWCAWCVAVFGVMNAGAPMPESEALRRELRSGVHVSAPHFVARAWLIQLSDYGDTMRYAAYASAALGHPYQPYFVRTSAQWHADFVARAGGEDKFDPEQPLVAPPAAQVPWRDYVVEYPPGFVPWALLPALVTSDPTRFSILFSLMMGGLMTAAVVVARRLWALLGGAPEDEPKLVVAAAALVVALGALTTHRFDPVVSLSIVVAMVAAFSGRPVVAGIALGVGVATKLVPGLAALPLAIWWWHEGKKKDLARAAAAGAAVVLLAWLPAVLVAGAAPFTVFRYHGERPLEIESTGALVLAALDRLGVTHVRRVYSHGSVNVWSPMSDAVLALSRWAFVAATVGTLAWTWVRMARTRGAEERRSLVAASTALLLVAFMGFSSVFSPQYVAWLVPLGLVVAMRRDRAAVVALVALCALTQAVYPTMFGDLAERRAIPIITGLSRNAVLFWFAWRLTAIVARRRPAPDSRAASATASAEEASTSDAPHRTTAPRETA